MYERELEMIRAESGPTPEYGSVAVVSEINFYPIKSMAGTRLEKAVVGPRGFVNDRNWMVVTPEGRFLTQREIPKMALVVPELKEQSLILRVQGVEALELPVDTNGEEVLVDIWKSNGVRAIDQGDETAWWLGRVLKRECRLVKMAEDEVRQVSLNHGRIGDQVGFADGYPFLLISEGSLADLNSRLDKPLPMNRFRPNIVVRGVEPYAEDGWKRIKIGKIEFEVVKPCARCKITTNNQETAELGKEPLKTLATYRRHDHLGIEGDTGVFFGQNLIHRSEGVLQLGDRLEVLELKA